MGTKRMRLARRLLALVPVLVTALAFGPGASAQTAPLTPCGEPTGVLCTTVLAPLDPTGAVPGTVSLHVEVLPPAGPSRGVMFLIAGGPGQGSARTFDLGSPAAAAEDQYIFPGYTLVAYDDRGTGASGLLDCPALQAATEATAERLDAASCAAQIGPARDFYSTADHAADLDAVRAALGYDQVGLYGVSYGTKLAMAYALGYPQHVDRLLLDSVLPPTQDDPFSASVLKQMPATLQRFCSNGGCRSATSDFAGDVIAVANKLAATPLRGKVGAKTVQVTGLDLLSIVLDADLNPGLAAELPAVIHAARVGNGKPLLRLSVLHNEASVESAADLSSALYAATVCHDGPFPWPPGTPVAARPALEQAAIAALPPDAFGGFGPWAARFGDADFCLDWPSPSGGATLGAGPLPNVPMLAVSGGFDMRTPTSGAASVVAEFPQGHLLVVPGIGHSTVSADFSGCAANAVRTWIDGGAVPASCPRPPALVTPVPGLPNIAAGQHLAPAATRAAVAATIHEAEAIWLMTTGVSGSTSSVAGIFGGTLTPVGFNAFVLHDYSAARGVAVSGTVDVGSGLPLGFSGIVTVSGAAASPGILGVRGSSLAGALGDQVLG